MVVLHYRSKYSFFLLKEIINSLNTKIMVYILTFSSIQGSYILGIFSTESAATDFISTNMAERTGHRVTVDNYTVIPYCLDSGDEVDLDTWC